MALPEALLVELETYINERVDARVRALLAERPDQGEYLSTAEAASLASVTQKTVRRWLDEGRLERHGAGQIRVKRQELETLLSGGRRKRRASAGALKASPESLAYRDIMGKR